MPGACQDFKAVQAQVYRISPRLKFTGFPPGTLPTPEQRHPFHQHSATGPFHTEQFTTAEQNSFQRSLVQRQPAPLLAVLPTLYPFSRAGTPNSCNEVMWNWLDLKINLGFLKMTQPCQTFILEFLFCISFSEAPTNTFKHFSGGFQKPKIELPASCQHTFAASYFSLQAPIRMDMRGSQYCCLWTIMPWFSYRFTLCL